MLRHSVIAAADIQNPPRFFKRFRGRVACESYRFVKGVLMSRSVCGPFCYAVSTIPTEFSKGFVHGVVNQIGESALGYISGIGFVRYVYKISSPKKLKTTARLVYNIGSLPMTLFSKGIGVSFDVVGLSKIETFWFGHPVYIFDDNRLWIEANFTISDVFESLSD